MFPDFLKENWADNYMFNEPILPRSTPFYVGFVHKISHLINRGQIISIL